MGSLTVAQMFEVNALHGAARFLKYSELSSAAPVPSNAAKAYRTMCRVLYARLYMGIGISREQTNLLDRLSQRFEFTNESIDNEVFTWGLGGYGSPSLREDFLLDLWARREIAVRNGWALDVLTEEQEDWVARFSAHISEKMRGTQSAPDLPPPVRKGTFDRSTPFPDEVLF